MRDRAENENQKGKIVIYVECGTNHMYQDNLPYIEGEICHQPIT
jgi:hypothetical protein